MTATTKQTAANNVFLARVKAVFNGGVYKATAELVNMRDESVARLYISKSVVNVTPDDLDQYLKSSVDRSYAGNRDRLPKLIR